MAGDQTYEDWTGEYATFGMSWFWFPEAQFGCVPGVIRTRVGYAGGVSTNPTYSRMGDHTEAVDIEFDPKVTSYEKLLDFFWKNHDPTTSKCSRQYMSAIFYHGEGQKKIAQGSLEREEKRRKKTIKTEIVSGDHFYEAEGYHQKYLLQRYPKVLEDLDIEPGAQLIKSYVAARLNGYLGGYGKMKGFDAEADALGLTPTVEQYVRKRLK